MQIRLDHQGDKPLYLQIAEALRDQIRRGTLEEHARLPAIRQLARSLGVNNSTVVGAYRQLEIQRLVYAKEGSGTYVAARESRDPEVPEAAYSFVPPEAPEAPGIDFTRSSPEPDFFPAELYKRLVNTVLDRDGGYAFSSPDIQGYPPLRESLVRWLVRRSIRASARDIQVTSGSQQALDIITKTLVRDRDYVAVESPVYPGALAAFFSRGAKVLEIPLRADGMDLNLLEDRARRHPIRFLYTMPCFQNPSGVTWTLRKKQELLSLANRYGFYILEDDFLSEFSYGSKNIQTLKELDVHHCVIYIKSIAKLLMPGVRLGFILVPEELSARIRTQKYLADLSTSGLSQRVLQLCLETESWEENFKEMRRQYQNKYSFLMREIGESFPPGITCIPPQGGLGVWLALPEGGDSSELARRASTLQVQISPGSTYYLNQKPNRFFRLAFAKTSLPEIRQGLSLLSGLLGDRT